MWKKTKSKRQSLPATALFCSAALVGVPPLLPATAASSATSGSAAQAEGTLQDVTLLDGESAVLTVPYRIGRVLIGDEDVARGRFTARSSSLEVLANDTGKSEIIVHDVANQVRDRFVVHVLSPESMSLWREVEGLFTDVEGLEIGVDGDMVVMRGSLFSEQDMRRVETEALRSPKLAAQVSLDPLVYVVLHGPSARYRASYRIFEEYDYRAWHGGRDHPHGAIQLENLELVVLRVEGPGGQPITERAEEVVERLNSALLAIARGSEGSFMLGEDEGAPAVLFQMLGAAPLVIARAYGGDAVGYGRRSPGYDASADRNRRVTPALVAAWWRAIIDDATNMFIRKQPPSAAARTGEGSVLALLYERASARAGGPPSTLQLAETFANADTYELRQVASLSNRIPAEFEGG